MNKSQMQMKKAMKMGMSPIEIAQMKEIARKEAARMEQQAIEKSFLYMLAIPVMVLANDYWPKTGNKKIPRFIIDVISLYESVQAGVVTYQQLADDLKELSGVDIAAEWMKGKEGDNDGRCEVDKNHN